MSSPGYQLSRGVGAVLIVLLAMTLATGCGGSSPTGSATASKRAAVQIGGSAGDSKKALVGATAGAQGRVTAARPAHSRATPKGTSAPVAIQRVSRSPSGGLLRRFAGYGNARLGTIVVRSASVLVWNVRHRPIQIFTSSGFMLVNSEAPNGTVRLARGTYRGVRVASGAGWSIELRSRSS